ncbi:unnamed protein product [Fraxinus pennsylvanica]|uniref:SET domain-containing protein n=1 Tax=Fraxinus pennsylvanica TaxID=56036 RepID=A0AAD1ZFH3_9LAMI|nr:unnamed protein product [Fraxinus pennsylvanica]
MREIELEDPKLMEEVDHEEQNLLNLRSKATEFLIREEYEESIQACSQFITLCQDYIYKNSPHFDSDHFLKLQKSICLSFSNRAEARFRLKEFSAALEDCDEALRIESTHFKTLLCKGKILLNLNKYGVALECFNAANLDPQANENSETLNGYLEKCKKLEFLSRTGGFDVSDWILSGFRGKAPELAEYVGAVDIKKSDISGRGLFTTKNIDSGTLLLVTKAIAIDRAIFPQDSGENVQLFIWKNFIDKVVDSATKCRRINSLISKLSTGENEDSMEVPEISLFRPEAADNCSFSSENQFDLGEILSILDVNSILEDAISSKVLGRNTEYQGVGLWVLPSFINHSCHPNVRRLHIGDHVVVHASRDLKAGEELTFAYFDVLSPLSNRREMAGNWGFTCCCKRCKFEDGIYSNQEMREIEMVLGKGLVDMGGIVYRLEESMRKWMVRGRAKGYLRTSYWLAYSKVYESEKLMRKWGRKIPSIESVIDSIVDAIGSDERVVKLYMEGGLKMGVGGYNGVVEMDKAMKFGRGVYGKVMKKQAMKILL